jgi:cytoskeletal protein CcmA (bactofilin family)
MKTIHKFLSVFSLFALLMLTFTTPALAFDGRSGDNVVIGADEVIQDDLYVGSNQFTLNGTVKGDLIVSGNSIVINGTVEGDLMAAGQSVIINGTVTDDVRIAGAVLQIGDKASIGGDVLSAGASLEIKKGSTVAGDLLWGGGQGLLAGNVAGDGMFGSGSLELRGEFGGNVKADVGNADAGGPPPSLFMPQTGVSVPTVTPGFTIAEGAKIKGNLVYTQSNDVKIPANAIGGKVTRTMPVVDPENTRIQQPTAAQKAMTWTFNLLRTIVTLILIGLLLGWLAPAFVRSVMEKIQMKPAASLGWGVVAYAAFFFTLLVVIVAMVLGGIIFGTLTLGGISGSIIWLGILALFALIVSFVLITSFLTKIVVAWISGKWLLGRFNPALSEHKVWPLVIGVVIVALVVALPYVGWIFGLIIMFLGLGALWFWGRESVLARKTA